MFPFRPLFPLPFSLLLSSFFLLRFTLVFAVVIFSEKKEREKRKRTHPDDKTSREKCLAARAPREFFSSPLWPLRFEICAIRQIERKKTGCCVDSRNCVFLFPPFFFPSFFFPRRRAASVLSSAKRRKVYLPSEHLIE